MLLDIDVMNISQWGKNMQGIAAGAALTAASYSTDATIKRCPGQPGLSDGSRTDMQAFPEQSPVYVAQIARTTVPESTTTHRPVPIGIRIWAKHLTFTGKT